jgi:predicted DNA-binding antitoxin AbrB/MazE fold protein
MDQTITAVFDAGVFRPLQPVRLAEGTRVQIRVPISNGLAAEPLPNVWPENYFEQIAGAFEGEEFERPSQGTLPERDRW